MRHISLHVADFCQDADAIFFFFIRKIWSEESCELILCVSVGYNHGFNPPVRQEQLHFLEEPLLMAPSAPIKLAPSSF